MLRVRGLCWLIGLGLLSGCDDAPRMERGIDDCEATLMALRVEVVSAEGARVRGATVTATNLTSNESISGVTDSDGVTTAVNERLAPSPVRVVATAGAKVSPASRVEWVCDTCNCVPEPAALTLELSP
ncbi:carboxypeptidase-like regulatory domain-containing protein [Myxococcus sp. CA040A]|uniref:carboxypeptidase-like regulatory domain-containing protein n=1 Tax=Myxococcus sp. CA040A TaxID=2741738 RepID=UPI00157B34D6|nr:carboxypeptidase-like regulatory domain-containing protein [Myxococcus sp. CA040A]NTX04150.1 carboxypeptidase regulatory-like domain-containing protein [Myxococcus sp. CA040A]